MCSNWTAAPPLLSCALRTWKGKGVLVPYSHYLVFSLCYVHFMPFKIQPYYPVADGRHAIRAHSRDSGRLVVSSTYLAQYLKINQDHRIQRRITSSCLLFSYSGLTSLYAYSKYYLIGTTMYTLRLGRKFTDDLVLLFYIVQGRIYGYVASRSYRLFRPNQTVSCKNVQIVYVYTSSGNLYLIQLNVNTIRQMGS